MKDETDITLVNSLQQTSHKVDNTSTNLAIFGEILAAEIWQKNRLLRLTVLKSTFGTKLKDVAKH